ncbi:MAG: preprotein translocase subunit SecE [Rhodospirillales bacterium]
MAKISPAQFIQEVRQEASKVTWPSRKETGISTTMVFLFVILASIFFLIVDQLLQLGVKTIFGFGG